MSHLVTLKHDPRNPGVIYLATDPSMAPVMGGFGPARYVGNTPPIRDVSYAIDEDDLDRFRVYCANRSVRLLDHREAAPTPAARPAWAERPLPECRECGQPAARGARLTFCPNCGKPWEAVEIGAPVDRVLVVTARCTECHNDTPVGWTHCIECGARTRLDG